MNRPCSILLLEDDPKEVELVRGALGKLNRAFLFNAVADVNEAKEFIAHSGVPAQAVPDLILIDIKLGSETGFEFLRWCKSVPDLSSSHLIVFTNSDYPKAKAETFKLGASAFEPKPLSFDDLVLALSRILNEWCD